MNETLAVTGMTGGLSLLRLVGALVLVLLAFWVFARAMKRMNVTRTAGTAGLELVASISLGPRERLVVLDAGDERIVLGVTAQTITRVHAMAAGAETTGPVVDRAPPSGLPVASGAAFADRLRAALVGGSR